MSSAAEAPDISSTFQAPQVVNPKSNFFRPLPLGPDPTSAFIEKSAVAVAATALPSRATLLREHFPAFLLKILYSGKVFPHLIHFVAIFKELSALGCPAPCDLQTLESFASSNPLDLEGDAGSFAPADLTSRMRFFSSALYRDFLERRSLGLLQAAQDTDNSTQRQKFLEALTVSVQSLDGEEAPGLQKKSGLGHDHV